MLYLHFNSETFGEFVLKLQNFNIIYGAEQSGKTQLLKYFAGGFSGLEKSFLINGLHVSKGEFDVLELSFHSGLADILKFTAKSQLKKELKTHLQEIKETKNHVFQEIELALNKTLNLSELESARLFPKIEIALDLDFDMIVEKCIQITFENKVLENLSRTESFFGMLEYLKEKCKDSDKLTVLLLDDLGAGMSKTAYKRLLLLLQEFPSHVYFIGTKSNSHLDDNIGTISFLTKKQLLTDCFVDELIINLDDYQSYNIREELQSIKEKYYTKLVDYITLEITEEEIQDNYLKTVAKFIEML